MANIDILGPFKVLKRPLLLTPKEAEPKAAEADSARPIAWWKFDEAQGATVANAAGTNLQGQIQGPPRRTSGQAPCGPALEFDGVKNWVEFADSSALDFRQGIAISTWFKVRAFDQPSQTLMAKGNAWRLQRQGEKGTLEFSLSGPATTGASKRRPPAVASKRPVDDGQWHHVAAVYDGKRLSLYLDGTEEDSVAVSGSLVLNCLPVTLGDNDASRGRLFNGWMGEARLYARGLSAAEIKELSQKK